MPRTRTGGGWGAGTITTTPDTGCYVNEGLRAAG